MPGSIQKKNEAPQKRAPQNQLSGEVASLLSSYSSLSLTDTGKVQCQLSGHEMPAKAEAIRTYLDGSAYRRAESRSRVDLDALLPYIVPSRTSPHKLFCKLTQREINYLADEVTAHMTGAKFLRLKAIADEESRKEEEEQARRAAKKAAWEASQQGGDETAIGRGGGVRSKRNKGMADDEVDDSEAAFVAAMDATLMGGEKDLDAEMVDEENEEEEEEEEAEEEKRMASKHGSKKRAKKSEPTSRIFLPSEVVNNDEESFLEAKKMSKRGSVFIDNDNLGNNKSGQSVEKKKQKKDGEKMKKAKEETSSMVGERRERDTSTNAGQLKKKKVKRDGPEK